MRKQTVRTGMNFILAGVVMLILATFYHGHIARLFYLSPAGEAMFIYLGFFLGGMSGCLGILITVVGLARSAGKGPEVRLRYTIIFLAAALILYFFLFYESLSTSETPRLRPGETIII